MPLEELVAVTDINLIILKYFLLFSIGTLLGWGIEVLWRRFFGKARRWINPGFLNGPWLPLYGFGCILMYFMCLPNLPVPFLALLFFIVLTVLEYLAGLIFIGYFKLKLWDYSRNRGNIRGIICPFYSFLWLGLGMVFYFFIFPNLNDMIESLYMHLELSFFIGLYGGVFLADLWQAFNVAGRIKAFVDEHEEKLAVDFEQFKLELRDRVQEGVVNRTHFFLPFHGELGASFRAQLKKHFRKSSHRLHPLSKVLKRNKRD